MKISEKALLVLLRTQKKRQTSKRERERAQVEMDFNDDGAIGWLFYVLLPSLLCIYDDDDFDFGSAARSQSLLIFLFSFFFSLVVLFSFVFLYLVQSPVFSVAQQCLLFNWVWFGFGSVRTDGRLYVLPDNSTKDMGIFT